MVKHTTVEKDSKNPLHKTITHSKDKFKKEIAKPLSNLLQNCSVEQIEQLIESSKNNQQHQGQFHLAFPKLMKLVYPSNEDSGSITPEEFCQTISKLFKSSVYIDKVSSQGQFLNFDVHQAEYVKQTLASILEEKENYGQKSCQRQHNNQVLIDFSSPNIAKPFYTDHLRSTLLGHFVRNIYQSQGYSTIASNYFGDWREQYGLLAVGFKKYGIITSDYEKSPVQVLHDIYIRIIQDAKTDPSISTEAKDQQHRLDQGKAAQQSQWLDFRTRTLTEYKKTYERLGISFDSYCGEDDIQLVIPTMITTLRQLHLLIEDEHMGYVDLSAYSDTHPNGTHLGKAVLFYADGTSSYLARDIACLIYRLDKYNVVNKIIYVAGMEQERHFKQMFQIIKLILFDQELPQFEQVSFGKIDGLFTKKQELCLNDLLDTGKSNMIKTMKEDLRNGKYLDLLEKGISVGDHDMQGEEAVDYIADQLSISAVIIQDMSAKRKRNYNFSWSRITDARGDTGVFLQYTHARICGIQRKMDFHNIPQSYRPSLIREKDAFELMYTTSLYPDILVNAFQTLDPCSLVVYLFRLAHLISQANYNLRVKDVEKRLSEARLCLFEAAKMTLANGMRIIGIRPLERM